MALLKWELFLSLACHGVKVTNMLASLVVWFVYMWINDLCDKQACKPGSMVCIHVDK